MTRRNRIRLALGAILVGLFGIAFALHAYMMALTRPNHVFELTEQPAFLTDSLAVEKARQTMTIEGFDPTEWQPKADERTTAPDGARDKFLSRNGINPNSGSILFTRQDGAGRFVHIELDGNRVVCRSSHAK